MGHYTPLPEFNPDQRGDDSDSRKWNDASAFFLLAFVVFMVIILA